MCLFSSQFNGIRDVFLLDQFGLYTARGDTLYYPDSISITDGNWHYVGVTWNENGTFTVAVDNVLSLDMGYRDPSLSGTE